MNDMEKTQILEKLENMKTFSGNTEAMKLSEVSALLHDLILITVEIVKSL